MTKPNRTIHLGKATIVGTGLVALDVVIDDESPQVQRLFAGGTCGNVLTILSFLGWNSFPVARIAKDSAGERRNS